MSGRVMGAARPDRKEADVAVIGGGPAGATAAALLASWGWSVALIHHGVSRHSLAESLPPSVRKLLAFVGALDIVDAAGFHPNEGNVSRWAGRSATVSTETPGYHVPRAAFDRLLRDRARARGAALVDAHVRHIDLSRRPVVECTSGRDVRTYSPSFVLDCTGRTGIVARRGLRRADAGYRTLAVTAEWNTPAWPAEERAYTFIDSYRNGWAWSVPLSPTRRQCTVMIDADRMTVRKAALGDVYAAELGKAVSIAGRLAGCRQASPPWACDASLYRAVRAADSRALLVGDAASFIEPLSSAGVKKALASAWRAAVVVNTALKKPGMLTVACEYHDRREHDVYEECTRRSVDFFSDAAAAFQDDFWTARATFPAARGRTGRRDTRGDPQSDEAVRRAFRGLCDAPSLDLDPAPSLRFERLAVVEGREIVLRDAVVVPGLDEPVRFAGGVNVPELIRVASGCRDVASLIDRYHREVGPVDSRSLLVSLSGLVARGMLLERR